MEEHKDEEKNATAIKNKLIGRKARKEIKEKIAEKEEKLGRELKLYERRKIESSVIRKVHRENAIRGVFFALGITVGTAGYAALSAGNTEKQAVESEYDSGKTNREKFVETLSVGQNDLIIEVDKNSKEYIKNQIDEMKTSEEVLDYIKDIVVKEYNEKNEDNIEKEQLKLYKSRFDQNLYMDEAKNGDKIIRYSSNNKNSEIDASRGVVSAEIRKDDKLQKIKVFYKGDGYKTIYGESEEVEQYSDTFLSEIAPIVDTGIDWSVAMDKEGTSDKVKNEYKNRLVNAIYEHNNKIQTNEDIAKGGFILE